MIFMLNIHTLGIQDILTSLKVVIIILSSNRKEIPTMTLLFYGLMVDLAVPA